VVESQGPWEGKEAPADEDVIDAEYSEGKSDS